MSGGDRLHGRLRPLGTLLSSDACSSFSAVNEQASKSALGQLRRSDGQPACEADQTLPYPEAGFDTMCAGFPSKSEPLRAWSLAPAADAHADPPMTQSYPDDVMCGLFQQPGGMASGSLRKDTFPEPEAAEAASPDPKGARDQELPDGIEDSPASTQEYPEDMPEDPALQVPVKKQRQAAEPIEQDGAAPALEQPCERGLAASAAEVDFLSTQAYPEPWCAPDSGVGEACGHGNDAVYDFPATQMYGELPSKGGLNSLTSAFQDKTINRFTSEHGSASSLGDGQPSPVKNPYARLFEDDSVFPATQCYDPDLFGGVSASGTSGLAGQGKTADISSSPSGAFQAGCQSTSAASSGRGSEVDGPTKVSAGAVTEGDPWFMATQCYETLPPEDEDHHREAAASSASKPAEEPGLLALAQQAVRAACDEECAMLATQWYMEDPPGLEMAKTESSAVPPEVPKERDGVPDEGQTLLSPGQALLSEVQSVRAEPPGPESSSFASGPGAEPGALDRSSCAQPRADAKPCAEVQPCADAAPECSSASTGKEPKLEQIDKVTAAADVPLGREPDHKPANAFAVIDVAPSSGAVAGEVRGPGTKVLGENGGACYTDSGGMRKVPNPSQAVATPQPSEAPAGSSGSEAPTADMPLPAAADGAPADPTLSADQLLQGLLTLLRHDETELLKLLRALDVEVPGLLARAMSTAKSMTKAVSETLKDPSVRAETCSTKRSKPSGANQGGVSAQKRHRRATSPGGFGSDLAAEGRGAPASSSASAASGSVVPKIKGKESSDDDELLTIGSDDDEMPLIPSKLGGAASGLQARPPVSSHANGWTYSRGGPSDHLGAESSKHAAAKGPGQLGRAGQGGGAPSSTVLHSVRPSQPRGGPSNAVANSTELPPRLQDGQSSAARASTRKRDPAGSAAQERQLQQIADMGFGDRSQALRALGASNGDVSRAVDLLLSGEC